MARESSRAPAAPAICRYDKSQLPHNDDRVAHIIDVYENAERRLSSRP